MFKSFFLAGYECATGYNRHGEWIDQVAATQHDRFADLDYQLLRELGIYAARDGVRWPLVDRRGRYSFASVESRLEAARKHGVDVVWDLFHYGYPDDVDLFSGDFPRRFADYCHATARHIAARTEGVCYFTPINEPSYFAWAAGDAGVFAPHQKGRSFELKVSLVRAAIQGINAIRDVCPEARIINADPMCRVVAPRERADLQRQVDDFNERIVFESWDMLCGRLLPELGGTRAHLDVPGINYYWTNQWELGQAGTPLADTDERCAPLRDLVRAVWERYGGEVMITETSHCGEQRAVWLRELAGECEALLEEGVPLRGVCLYPILGMPEWHCQTQWTRMGLWDLVPQSPTLGRIPCESALQAFREAQRRLERSDLGEERETAAEGEMALGGV